MKKNAVTLMAALMLAVLALGAAARAEEAEKPAPGNMRPEAEAYYPYMGMSYEIPEELLEKILDGAVFMDANGAADLGLPEDGSVPADFELDMEKVFLKSGYVDFTYVPDAAREGMPGEDNPMSYEAFAEWKAALPALARISVYREGEDISALDAYAVTAPIGSFGGYTLYFSVNEGGEYAELLALCARMGETLEASEPRKLDDDFMGLTEMPFGDVAAIRGFEAEALDGGTVTDAVFGNAKVTMVNIWTTWCSPCINEMPDLAAIAKEMAGEGLQILGIAQDTALEGGGGRDEEKVELAKVICEKTGVDYTVLIPDAALQNGALKNILGFPTTFFVDSQGNVLGESVLGSNTKAEWEDRIRGALAAAE